MIKNVQLFVALAVLFVSVVAVSAAPPENRGPASVKMQMGAKTLVFSHHKHQKYTKDQCWECHDKKVGKIDNWNKATAHKICIPCHDLNEKGPTTCKGCHKK